MMLRIAVVSLLFCCAAASPPGVIEDVNRLASSSGSLATQTADVADAVTKKLTEADAEVQEKEKQVKAAEVEKEEQKKELTAIVEKKKADAEAVVKEADSKLGQTKNSVNKYKESAKTEVNAFLTELLGTFDGLYKSMPEHAAASFLQMLPDVIDDVRGIAKDSNTLAADTRKVADAVAKKLNTNTETVKQKEAEVVKANEDKQKEVDKMTEEVKQKLDASTKEVTKVQQNLEQDKSKMEGAKATTKAALDSLTTKLMAIFDQMNKDVPGGFK